MSLESLAQSAADLNLTGRTFACAVQQAHSTFADTALGARIALNPAAASGMFVWDVALNGEAAYEAGIAAGLARPDLNVTDLEVLAAVQAAWPGDPTP